MKHDIQGAIKLLITIHEDDHLLEAMAEANGGGATSCTCKGSLGAVVRFLMAMRDNGKDINETQS